MKKEAKAIKHELEACGYLVVQGRTHLLVKGRNGCGNLASIPLSPHAHSRWEANLRAELRRRGLLNPN